MIGSQVQVKLTFPKLDSWNTSRNLFVIWNNLLKDFQYLSLVKSCNPILTVGTIAVSIPRPQLVTDATSFVWISLLHTFKNYVFYLIWWNIVSDPHTMRDNYEFIFTFVLVCRNCSELFTEDSLVSCTIPYFIV